jgi:epoxyqueuosine reductase
MAPDLDDLAALVLDETAFRESFRRSAIKRTRRRGLLRNLAIALGNSSHPNRDEVLTRLAADEDPLVQEHANWARERGRGRERERP